MGENEIDNVVLVGDSTRIPELQQMLEDLFGPGKLCRSINQEEAVAYGVAVQAAVLTGQRSEVVLQDVTPLSLGVEVEGGIMSVIIPKNTPIPVTKVQTFTTFHDYQTAVTVSVYEGERIAVKDNNLLGSFHVPGIPASLRGEEKVDETFEIDANGILKVSAQNKGAGEKSIIISKDNCRLTRDEIVRMKTDAERYRVEDERVALKHEARHALENYVYGARNRARGHGLRGTMSAEDAETIEMITKFAIDWIEKNNNAATEEFQMKLGEVEQLCKAFQNFSM
ncbi:hypothetical protein SUGI_0711120 [Cryptomeria japonica]|nr:hypothetical protein SUGI_0711120 [Cryptomeria japonica]